MIQNVHVCPFFVLVYKSWGMLQYSVDVHVQLIPSFGRSFLQSLKRHHVAQIKGCIMYM